MVFVSRTRFLAGGKILEDMDINNKAHEMFNNVTTEGSRYNDYAKGFRNVWESAGVCDSRAQNLDGVDNNDNAVFIKQLQGVFGSLFQTVLFKPLSGTFNQHK